MAPRSRGAEGQREGLLDFLTLSWSRFEMCAVLHSSEGASSLAVAVDGGESCSEVLLVHLEKLNPPVSIRTAAIPALLQFCLCFCVFCGVDLVVKACWCVSVRH